ncbi:hypothetical protein BDV93DRAFT_570576 [Ceratobasidium sp. AG-I]|nr:hypothetical protein BDV93DRAFT_570576 [Ceratobasidium sp. AG-I]
MDDRLIFMRQNNEPPSDMSRVKTILVCGLSGAGKSRFINTVTTANLPIGHGINSETVEVTEQGIPLVQVDDMYVQLVDTPGFEDDRDETEQPVLQRIAEWLGDRYRADAPITGLIYLRPIHTNRIGRSEETLINMFKELCGKDCLDRVMLVTNRWNDDPEEEEENKVREKDIATSPRGFGSFGTKRVEVRRLKNKYTRDDGLHITRYFWHLPPVILQIQKEVVDEGKTTLETAAGVKIGGNLIKQVEDMNRDIAEAQRQLEEMRRPVKRGFWSGLGAFAIGCVVSAATLNPTAAIVGWSVATGIWSLMGS